MRKVLINNSKVTKKIESLPRLYVVCFWMSYGILTLPFSGKYKKGPSNEDIPLVWDHTDLNGAADLYVLTPIDEVTTGGIICWTPYKERADQIADSLNNRRIL